MPAVYIDNFVEFEKKLKNEKGDYDPAKIQIEFDRLFAPIAHQNGSLDNSLVGSFVPVSGKKEFTRHLKDVFVGSLSLLEHIINKENYLLLDALSKQIEYVDDDNVLEYFRELLIKIIQDNKYQESTLLMRRLADYLKANPKVAEAIKYTALCHASLELIIIIFGDVNKIDLTTKENAYAVASNPHDLADLKKQIPLKLLKDGALHYGSHSFIESLFSKDGIDISSKENAIAVATNPNDLAYLLQRFPQDVITSIDDKGNTLLHLVVLARNPNVFEYLINYYGHELFYKTNKDGKTPIDLVYEESVKDEAHNPFFGFAMLTALDQAGADLETTKYPAIKDAYDKLQPHQRAFMMAKQVRPKVPITCVSYNGGGIKGLAFNKAYETLLREGVFGRDENNQPSDRQIKAFAGTSAGAITAFLKSLGCTGDKFEELFKSFDFKQLFTPADPNVQKIYQSHIKTWRKYYLLGYYKTLVAQIVSALVSESTAAGIGFLRNGITGVKEASDLISGVIAAFNGRGIFKSDALRNKLHDLLEEKIAGIDLAELKAKGCSEEELKYISELKTIKTEFITLQDMKRCPSVFKELVVYVTNITQRMTETLSAESKSLFSVVDAVVWSLSIPFFFEAQQKREVVINATTQERSFKYFTVHGKPVYLVDGGVFKNDPVDAFDQNGFNPNTLAFVLMSSKNKAAFEDGEFHEEMHSADNLLDILLSLFHMSRATEKKQIHLDPRNRGRIVYIDTKFVGTVDFDKVDECKPILDKAGEDGSLSYLSRRTANGRATISPQLRSLLTLYGCDIAYVDGTGYVTELNAGPKKLLPRQVMRLYAAATDDEIYILRAIVNPNIRDKFGKSALSIAKFCEFPTVAQRLLNAGANPEFDPILSYDKPDFLKRGEDFLRSGLSDEDLDIKARFEAKYEKLVNINKEFAVANSDQKIEIKKLKDQSYSLNQQNNEIQIQIGSLQNRIKKLFALCLKFFVRFFVIKRELNAKNKELAQTGQQIDRLKEEMRAGFEHRDTELKAKDKTINDLNIQIDTLKAENSTLKSEQSSQNNVIQQLRERLTAVERERDELLHTDTLKLLRKSPISDVRLAIESLKLCRDNLNKELLKLNTKKDKDHGQIALKQEKVAGMNQMITSLETDYTHSAEEILKKAQNDHCLLFNGFFRSRTQNACQAVVKAEKKMLAKFRSCLGGNRA